MTDFETMKRMLALRNERVPVYLTKLELEALSTAVVALKDATEYLRTGEMTDYLRDWFATEDEDRRAIADEDLEVAEAARQRLQEASANHPSTVEFKRMRES